MYGCTLTCRRFGGKFCLFPEDLSGQVVKVLRLYRQAMTWMYVRVKQPVFAPNQCIQHCFTLAPSLVPCVQGTPCLSADTVLAVTLKMEAALNSYPNDIWW